MGTTIEITNETLSQIIEMLQKHLSQNSECSNNLHNFTGHHLSEHHGAAKKIIPSHDNQVQAVVYIVVVLMFYSITLATLLIKYMRHESRTAQEEQVYQDFLTKTKHLALQQTKRDFARRVSLQLVHMANFGQMRYPDRMGRMSTVVEVSELEAIQTKLAPNADVIEKTAHGTPVVVSSLGTESTPLHDDETTEDSIPDISDPNGKTFINRMSIV